MNRTYGGKRKTMLTIPLRSKNGETVLKLAPTFYRQISSKENLALIKAIKINAKYTIIALNEVNSQRKRNTS